jgi:DNA-binding transcriptional LysR family regulator
MFDWSDLRHFLAVHRARSLSAAAKSLHVDQTTVGRRIAHLETGLGAKLFDRIPNGLRLTEAGRDVLAIAERLEAEALALERLVHGRDVNPKGTVRLTTSEAFGARFLGPRLHEIRSKYEGIQLEVISDVRTFNLSRREADIAVRMAPTTQEELVTKKVSDVGFSLYAAKSYLARHGTPRTEADLATHAILGNDNSLSELPEDQWLERAARGATFVLRSNSTLLVHSAVHDGVGIAMLPRWLGDADDALARVLPKESYVARELMLVVHADLRRVARVQVVFRALAEIFERDRAVLAAR